MKTTARLHLTLATARLAAAAVTGYAQTWDSENVLYPSPSFAPTGGGHAVLIDPFNSTPAPGVFLGINNYGSGSATIMRLTPNDASSLSFTVADVDSGLTAATRLANNAGDALYAAGYAPVDLKAKNITYIPPELSMIARIGQLAETKAAPLRARSTNFTRRACILFVALAQNRGQRSNFLRQAS